MDRKRLVNVFNIVLSSDHVNKLLLPHTKIITIFHYGDLSASFKDIISQILDMVCCISTT